MTRQNTTLSRVLPFLDLAELRPKHLIPESLAALSVTMLAIPQGVAYALIAGLPPAMGLYACGIPVILGGLFRSSKHVVTGPSNALSLLVGSSLVACGSPDPIGTALTLALMVGLFQMAAGLLRLGGVVDYISSPVVRGYVAGAGVLIAVGQLPNATGVVSPQSGNLIERLSHWLQHCPNTHLLTVLVATLTIALILAFRRINPRIPGGLITLFAAAGVSSFLDLNGRGLAVVSDIASVPTDMFAISVPNISTVQDLLPYAVACTVLSLVESAAVARSIASKTGQRLDSNMEFFGQGLANLLASFFNGYTISGSLARSTHNPQTPVEHGHPVITPPGE